ncbi:osteoclast stimulatory transmembrane protein [Arapaima gigas]
MLLCLVATSVTGGLLYSWMVGTLRYGRVAAGATAYVYGTAAFLLLFFVHPARCVFTVALPTLGTKQGRKLVLSTAVMLLMLNTVPNIATNVGVLSRLLKCTSENLVHSLIDSSGVVNRAKGDLTREATSVNDGVPQIVSSRVDFPRLTNIDTTAVQQRFNSMSENIKRDLSHTSHVLRRIQLVANRLLAGLFVICLFFESAVYLKSYLTNEKFDNICITRKLISMAQANGVHISPGSMKHLQRSTSCSISRQELLRCVPRIAVVTLYFVATLLVVTLDYMVYHLIGASKPWVLNIPSADVNVSIDFKVHMYFPALCIINLECKKALVDFQKVYSWSLSARSKDCTVDLSEPHQGVIFLLGFLYLVAYSMVFLEVYATRSRRAMASSFFRWQEEKRVRFIYQKILAKEQKKNGIFFIEATQGSSGCESATPTAF